MGKPYKSELLQLNGTYEWARGFEASLFENAVLSAGSSPLVAVGSGGSLTAAHFMASAHRLYARQVATVATPLDAITEQLNRRVSIWLISAGGSNVDIISAFSAIVSREPAQIGILCAAPGSPLIVKAKQHQYVDAFDFSVPVGKDGFLATNSLLTFCVLIARAYAKGFHKTEVVPDASSVGLDEEALAEWKEIVTPLWNRDTTLVLHSATSKVGAIDLESKFTEAALGNLQIADYRNFAHGRHNWLSKRGKSSGVLAFITPEDRDLANKTLSLIPKDIPVAPINIAGGHLTTSLASLVVAFHVAGWAGMSRGIDPGRPGVPPFGRKLYNLRLPRKKQARDVLSPDDAAAIERKAGLPVKSLYDRGDFDSWRVSLTNFKRAIAGARFSAVVFDYDGTLVDTRFRSLPPSKALIAEMIRLHEAGLVLGVATGRGASVRRDLQTSLPRSLWKEVIIGYYNGAEVSLLSDDTHPDGTRGAGKELRLLAQALRSHPELAETATQEDRHWQITLEPRQPLPEGRLWDITSQIVHSLSLKGICVVRSSHSIDIIAPGASKLNVVKRVTELCERKTKGRILLVGDRGKWPGNDFVLLSSPYALSVDEVSVDPSTCWNLAPRGQRGPQATLRYCRALTTARGGGARFIFHHSENRQ